MPIADPRAFARTLPPRWKFSSWTAPDGWAHRRYDCVPEGTVCGTLLFQTGRGDCPEKYLDALAHWVDAGWHVTGFDWRGQGGSGRLSADPHTGHVDSFDVWIADLQAFWAALDAPGPRIAMGHSMGGHLLLRGALEGVIAPDGLILSAPMLGFDTPVPPAWIAPLVRLLARRWPERRAWGSNEKPGALVSRQTLLTHDATRYQDELWWRDHVPQLVMGPPSLSWLAAAWDSCQRIEALAQCRSPDCLTLFLGTDGDALVSAKAIRHIAALLNGVQIHMYGKEAAHELLRELDPVRSDMISRIDAFLKDVLARHGF